MLGAVCPVPLGSYRYRKRQGSGASLMVDVDVFPLAITDELDAWKEQGERERRWFSLDEASGAVDEEDLGHPDPHVRFERVPIGGKPQPAARRGRRNNEGVEFDVRLVPAPSAEDRQLLRAVRGPRHDRARRRRGDRARPVGGPDQAPAHPRGDRARARRRRDHPRGPAKRPPHVPDAVRPRGDHQPDRRARRHGRRDAGGRAGDRPLPGHRVHPADARHGRDRARRRPADRRGAPAAARRRPQRRRGCTS